MSEELVEVIDENDVPYAVVPRAQMRAENLRHRAVFIVVFDSEGRLLAHQRATWKDVWPSRWDIAFGGVVAVGESFEDAARRELVEEAGVEEGRSASELELIGVGCYEDELVREVGAVFRTISDGPFRFTDGEVVATEWVPYASLDDWVAQRAMVPDSLEIVLGALRGVDG